MKNQGILGGLTKPAHKLILLAATALIALAAPAAANAAATVSAEYDSGEDTIFVFVDGDAGNDNVTVSGAGAQIFSVQTGSADGVADTYCTGASPAVCDPPADANVVLIASLGDGSDTFDGSGSTGRMLNFNILGEGGADSLTGSPFPDYIEGGTGADFVTAGAGEDYLSMNDGQPDAAGSDCGDGADLLDRDYIDPAVANCEDVATFNVPSQTPPPPSNVFTPGKFKGTSLSITTPGAGVLTSGPASGATGARTWAFAAKKKKALVGTAKVTATGAGIFKLPVKLTSAGKKQLKKKKKLKVKVKVTFAPNGGVPASQTVSVTFKKKKK